MFCEFPITDAPMSNSVTATAGNEVAATGEAPACLTYVLVVDAKHEDRVRNMISAIPGATFYTIRSGPTSPIGLRAGQLSERLEQILLLVGKGMSNKAIGRMLGISHFTVRNHVARLLRLYGVANRDELVKLIDRRVSA